MPRVPNVLSRVFVQWLAVVLLVAGMSPPVRAQVTLEARDYDLVTETKLFHYAQTNGLWASFAMGPDRTVSIGECGCLLSVLATVLNHQVTGISPWFATEFIGNTGALDFNPRYLDLFLYAGPSGNTASGWGYKRGLAPDTCGIIPLAMALQSLGTFGGSPVGIDAVVVKGFGRNVKAIINQNLNGGRPTIVMLRLGDSRVANHAVLIAGWDNDVKGYTVLDPMTSRTGINGVKLPELGVATVGKDSTIAAFEAKIAGIIDIRPGTSAIRPGFLFGDDPSPIEILMTGPDGRRTGFDPATGASYEDNDGASYWTFGPWSDPLGEVRATEAPRFIAFPSAPAGTYAFEVTGTSDGPLQLSAETVFGGTRVVVAEFGGAITAGEVRKYELHFAPAGTSTATQVSNFTPHADAGEDLNARTDAAVTFNGSRSFDADGVIASFAWDFGDGRAAAGSAPQHVYAVPGDYAVTLTVTDADGATATDSLRASVILSQQRPVADASGPYIGFASTLPDWSVLLDGRRSTDPNGDPLTYRWDFGDGSSIQTTTVGYVDHVYEELGVYTLTLVVNDGLDDSAPATATVEIVEVPTNRLSFSGEGVLTPSCGVPGTDVTLSIGSYGQFQSWDFGSMGALPTFPPTHLILGFNAPDGQMRIILPGDERVYVPFQATLLSPGRFNVEATFTVPDVADGPYDVGWAEEAVLPFEVPCPVPANRPPLADAGGPYPGGVGSSILFDGSASSDPDGDALTYEWDFGDGEYAEGVAPSHSYANEGSYIVSLIVSDGQARSRATVGTDGFARATITAGSRETIAPTTTAVNTPPADSDGSNTTDVTVDLSAVDNPGGSGVREITFALSGAQTGAGTVPGDAAQIVITHEGTTELTYFATDNAGNVEALQQRIVRIVANDRTGPTITGMPGAGCSLWPPNHKLVTVAQVSASDDGSGMAPDGLLVTATSSEPENALGDGNTGPDIVITGGSVALRAERSGTGVGRTYTITATATDRAGNLFRAVSVCVVPHDQRAKR